MKPFFLLMALFLSSNLFAQTDFSAVVIKDLNVLSISISDDGLIPPFEAGEMWKIMKGTEQRKYFDEAGFSLECDGLMSRPDEVYGACTINIPMNLFLRIGDMQVYKLKGSAASRINRYFIDNAYLSIQGGRVYLSSYYARREFYFGIQDNLIKR